MSDIKLTYDETPLAWPASVSIDAVPLCSTCGIRILAPQPGSLQCLSRRPTGDGVTIEEYIGIGADYRGQRYTFEEAIFHTPGLHIFPGQKELYPAEYHIHMRTMSAPIRYITIVVPVSHMVAESHTRHYFASIAARPDPATQRPTLETLFREPNTKVLQYQGPDIRGRTADQPIPATQNTAERQFLLVLQVANIRASDLERIPREGSTSTDPRDLPAPGVKPKKVIVQDHLLRSSILATPGILHEKTREASSKKMEMDCKPVKVVDGRDIIETFDGKIVDVKKLLGIDEAASLQERSNVRSGVPILTLVTFLVSISLGIIIANVFAEKFWTLFFVDSDLLHKMSWMKVVFYLLILYLLLAYSEAILLRQ